VKNPSSSPIVWLYSGGFVNSLVFVVAFHYVHEKDMERRMKKMWGVGLVSI
jgi:hypothetical protein